MRSKPFFICAVCLVIFASGCAQHNIAPQTTTVAYYPECYQPIDALRKDNDNTTTSTVIGSVTGAVLGGIVGALTTGKVSGALIGAGAGAVAGGAIGYASARQKAITDARARYESYVTDISTDISKLDQITLAAKASTACYEQQFDKLTVQFKEKQISTEEYKLRYAEIRSGLSEASAMLGATYNNAKSNEEQYQAALDDEAKKAGVPVPDATRIKANAQTVAEAAPAPAPEPAKTKKKTSKTKTPTSTASKEKAAAAAAAESAKPAPLATTENTIVSADSTSEAPDRNFIEGLDKGSLEAVSSGVAEHRAAAEDARIQQAAIDSKLLKMDELNTSLLQGT